MHIKAQTNQNEGQLRIIMEPHFLHTWDARMFHNALQFQIPNKDYEYKTG